VGHNFSEIGCHSVKLLSVVVVLGDEVFLWDGDSILGFLFSDELYGINA
jgi:hypothetical protein